MARVMVLWASDQLVNREVTRYALRHLERSALGTPYPAIVDRVATLMKSKPLKGTCPLVADSTGGLQARGGLPTRRGVGPWAVSITGGTSVAGNA